MIKHLEIRVHENDKLSDDRYYFSRVKVLALLRHKVVFYTVHPNNGGWINGESVNIININGKEYIRTDMNREESDFLFLQNELNC